MGRRLLLLIGLTLFLAWQPVLVRGQDAPEKGSAPQGASPVPQPPATPEEAEGSKSGVRLESGPGLSDALPATQPAASESPGQEVPDPQPAKKPGKGKNKQLMPRRDPEVKPTGDPGEPAAASLAGAAPGASAQPPPAPAPVGAPQGGETPPNAAGTGAEADEDGKGSGYVLPADHLPLGKQEVVVSVEVQAPPALTFNREAIFKLVVRNSGSTDAMGVVVRDELPAGLDFVSSQPEAQKVGDSLYSWRISTLPAGSERVILLKGKPNRNDGSLDHAATVMFQAGSKATSQVRRPRLKLEVVQAPTDGKVLKNKTAEFRIAVINQGNGPARNVTVQAKLSGGLRHDTGERNDDNSFELPIQELGAGQREDLDPLTVDAIQGGQQWCRVEAKSPDVDFDKDSSQVTRKVEVVEPQLRMTLTGPDKRFTDTVAPYTIMLENTGTAPARNVKILATLDVSGRLVKYPPGAKYDAATRRLQWTIPQIDIKDKPRALEFEIRMGGISKYEVNVEARGDNGIYQTGRKITDVQGMPDVDLVVREKRRVVDVDGTTSFFIRVRNYGTKEATNLKIWAKLSSNLTVKATGGGPSENATGPPTGDEVDFPIIPRLGAAKEMDLWISVKVTKPEPRLATCRIFLKHDDLTEPLEDMAGVKVTESRRTAATGP